MKAQASAVGVTDLPRAEAQEQLYPSRTVVGNIQAKGILMERHRLTAAQAFVMLRRVSNDNNVEVRDLARTVVETGALL